MGRTLMGGSKHEKNIELLTPQQRQFLSSVLGAPGMTNQVSQTYGNLLQPFSMEGTQDMFNKSVVDPAMMDYKQNVLPAIQQRFVDANAGSSSALNQALSQSANDLTTGLGSQYMNFFQGQQQHNQQGQINALSGLGGLAGQQTFQPMISKSGGILGIELD